MPGFSRSTPLPPISTSARACPTDGTLQGRLACGCWGLGRRAFTGLLLGAAAAPALAVVPECRRSKTTQLVPAAQVETAAQQQYAQLLREAQNQRALAPENHPQVQRLRYIASRITPLAPACNDRAQAWQWEVNLLGSKQINAFCMPGGKIAFYSGILSSLKLDDNEVAMIMGHEVAHALLEHARERMAKGTLASGGLRLGAALLGLGNLGDLAAQGAANLLSLKFGRSDESEADALGLVLAARAGYDPRAGVTLWQKMGAATGGSAAPEWLSTHPAGSERIKAIEARLPQVLPSYANAQRPSRSFPVAKG
jgi:predicted Zn-dependent protease